MHLTIVEVMNCNAQIYTLSFELIVRVERYKNNKFNQKITAKAIKSYPRRDT